MGVNHLYPHSQRHNHSKSLLKKEQQVLVLLMCNVLLSVFTIKLTIL